MPKGRTKVVQVPLPNNWRELGTLKEVIEAAHLTDYNIRVEFNRIGAERRQRSKDREARAIALRAQQAESNEPNTEGSLKLESAEPKEKESKGPSIIDSRTLKQLLEGPTLTVDMVAALAKMLGVPTKALFLFIQERIIGTSREPDPKTLEQ